MVRYYRARRKAIVAFLQILDMPPAIRKLFFKAIIFKVRLFEIRLARLQLRREFIVFLLKRRHLTLKERILIYCKRDAISQYRG